MTKSDKFKRLSSTENVRSNLRKVSARAGLYTGISGFANLAMRLGSTAILARLIVPEYFGLVMMTMAVTAIADQLRELGLSAATVQSPTITHQEVSNLFWINVGVGFFIAFSVCAVSPLISAFYQDPRLTFLTCVMSLTFVFGGLTVQHQALLTRQLKLGNTASVRFLSGLVSNLIAILLAWLGHGLWALIARELSRSALLAAGMWICCPWIPSWPSRSTDVRSMLNFGANLTAANIICSIISGVDRFLIGRMLGPAPVGVYRQAFQLISAPTDQLLSPLYQVAQPALSMLQTDAARYRRFYRTVLTLVAAITMPLSLFVAVYAKPLTLALLGPMWLECAPLIAILSLGTFIRQCAGSAVLILITSGRSRTHLVLTLLNSLALVIAYFIGIQWGLEGVAYAEVAVVYLLLVPRLYFTFRYSPVTFTLFLASISRPAIASILTAFALLYSKSTLTFLSSAGLTLLVGAAAGAIAFISFWLLLPGGRAELIGVLATLRAGLKPQNTSAPAPVSVPTNV